MQTPDAAFRPRLQLLVAVADATMSSEYATAAEIRAKLDGGNPQGKWARTLHDHTDAGYLNRLGSSGPYSLTEKAVELLNEDFYV